jgi:hypothetical protein
MGSRRGIPAPISTRKLVRYDVPTNLNPAGSTLVGRDPALAGRALDSLSRVHGEDACTRWHKNHPYTNSLQSLGTSTGGPDPSWPTILGKTREAHNSQMASKICSGAKTQHAWTTVAAHPRRPSSRGNGGKPTMAGPNWSRSRCHRRCKSHGGLSGG